MSETARHLTEAADLIDQGGASVNDALRAATSDSPRGYTLACMAFREHGEGSSSPRDYAVEFGRALTAHRMREVARALQNA